MESSKKDWKDCVFSGTSGQDPWPPDETQMSKTRRWLAIEDAQPTQAYKIIELKPIAVGIDSFYLTGKEVEGPPKEVSVNESWIAELADAIIASDLAFANLLDQWIRSIKITPLRGIDELTSKKN